jgi:hypothetical protein
MEAGSDKMSTATFEWFQQSRSDDVCEDGDGAVAGCVMSERSDRTPGRTRKVVWFAAALVVTVVAVVAFSGCSQKPDVNSRPTVGSEVSDSVTTSVQQPRSTPHVPDAPVRPALSAVERAALEAYVADVSAKFAAVEMELDVLVSALLELGGGER